MKICKKCEKNLEDSEFYYGRRECKKCLSISRKDYKNEWREKNKERVKKVVHENYLKNKEKVLERSKRWRENNKETFKKSWKKSDEKFPLKKPARRILRYYLEIKEIVRPENCDKCFKKCKPDAHHLDYTKPLDVLWLCKSCHGREHRLI